MQSRLEIKYLILFAFLLMLTGITFDSQSSDLIAVNCITASGKSLLNCNPENLPAQLKHDLPQK